VKTSKTLRDYFPDFGPNEALRKCPGPSPERLQELDRTNPGLARLLRDMQPPRASSTGEPGEP
jgi:hypothetical protein